MRSDHRTPTLFFSMTLEFLETYLPRQCGRSPHTVESYRDALSLFRRYVVNALGVSMRSFTFAECTRECVTGFMDYLAARKSNPGTRNHRLAVLKSYLAFAADKDVALQSTALAVGRVPQFRQVRTERVMIPDEAMAAILRQPPETRLGLRDRTIMVMMYDSGGRLAEILGLRTSDIATDGDNPYVRINGKGGKQRIVPVSERLSRTSRSTRSISQAWRPKNRPSLLHNHQGKDRAHVRGQRRAFREGIRPRSPTLLPSSSRKRASPYVPQDAGDSVVPKRSGLALGLPTPWSRETGDDPGLCEPKFENAARRHHIR